MKKPEIQHYIVAFVLTVMLIEIGCAKPPEQELNNFRMNHPEEYAQYIKPELEAQANKFALFRSYSKAMSIVRAINHNDGSKPIEEIVEKAESQVNYFIREHDMGNGVTCYTYHNDGISCVKN